MISNSDFQKKQILFVLFNEGEKLSFSNDNIVVRRNDKTVKMQCSCYRIFIVYAIGHCSVTDVLLDKAKKFGFSIFLFSSSWRPLQKIGSSLEGNTVLRKIQYDYDGLEIAKHITKNKINNQRELLKSVRSKNEMQKDAINLLKQYSLKIDDCKTLNEIMGYEGTASKVYFSSYFNNVLWKRREPRIKRDYINATLDIGYTVLFSFIESLLSCYGFDVYCGVMHKNFYMSKSLVCDIVEPFRVLMDKAIHNAINLKQCKREDFVIQNGRYILKWEKNAEYIKWLSTPLMENKKEIHLYIQNYYRAFVRRKDIENFPVYLYGESKNDTNQL